MPEPQWQKLRGCVARNTEQQRVERSRKKNEQKSRQQDVFLFTIIVLPIPGDTTLTGWVIWTGWTLSLEKRVASFQSIFFWTCSQVYLHMIFLQAQALLMVLNHQDMSQGFASIWEN